jgi:hypothetical protein
MLRLPRVRRLVLSRLRSSSAAGDVVEVAADRPLSMELEAEVSAICCWRKGEEPTESGTETESRQPSLDKAGMEFCCEEEGRDEGGNSEGGPKRVVSCCCCCCICMAGLEGPPAEGGRVPGTGPTPRFVCKFFLAISAFNTAPFSISTLLPCKTSLADNASSLVRNFAKPIICLRWGRLRVLEEVASAGFGAARGRPVERL